MPLSVPALSIPMGHPAWCGHMLDRFFISEFWMCLLKEKKKFYFIAENVSKHGALRISLNKAREGSLIVLLLYPLQCRLFLYVHCHSSCPDSSPSLPLHFIILLGDFQHLAGKSAIHLLRVSPRASVILNVTCQNLALYTLPSFVLLLLLLHLPCFALYISI